MTHSPPPPPRGRGGGTSLEGGGVHPEGHLRDLPSPHRTHVSTPNQGSRLATDGGPSKRRSSGRLQGPERVQIKNTCPATWPEEEKGPLSLSNFWEGAALSPLEQSRCRVYCQLVTGWDPCTLRGGCFSAANPGTEETSSAGSKGRRTPPPRTPAPFPNPVFFGLFAGD